MSDSERLKPVHFYFNQNWQEQFVGSTIRVLTPTNGTELTQLQPLLEKLTQSAEYFRDLDDKQGFVPARTASPFTVAVFDQESYWQRFVEKAERDGFDPNPWHWSEGDIDDRYADTLGMLFCLNIDKCMPEGRTIPTDIKRFIFHELDHLWLYNRIAPVAWSSIFEREGLAEAEARIGFDLQGEPDMQSSTDFLLSPQTQLVPPVEIILRGYDHPAFTGKVSESPGYASCFLWYLGLTLRVSGHADLKTAFDCGNTTILKLVQEATSRDHYFDLFQTKFNINYQTLLQTTKLMIEAQRALERQFVTKGRK